MTRRFLYRVEYQPIETGPIEVTYVACDDSVKAIVMLGEKYGHHTKVNESFIMRLVGDATEVLVTP